MRDTRSLLLVLLSVGLVGTWVYHLYDKTRYSKAEKQIYIKDSLAVAQGVQDSLQKIYAATINNLDTKLDSTINNADSLQSQLNSKLGDINRLKNEINNILKKGGTTKEDLNVARGKIKELQDIVGELKTEKLSLEEEKEKLSGVMEQLSGEVTGLQESITKLSEENKQLAEKVNMASVFVAYGVDLKPVNVRNNRELVTNSARKVKKMIVSFSVKNNISDFANAELYIAITQPDGEVLKNEGVLDSGELTTSSGAKVPFTRRMKFEYKKGEIQNLIFSINAQSYSEGTYTLKIYHKGFLIGQATAMLS